MNKVHNFAGTQRTASRILVSQAAITKRPPISERPFAQWISKTGTLGAQPTAMYLMAAAFMLAFPCQQRQFFTEKLLPGGADAYLNQFTI